MVQTGYCMTPTVRRMNGRSRIGFISMLSLDIHTYYIHKNAFITDLARLTTNSHTHKLTQS